MMMSVPALALRPVLAMMSVPALALRPVLAMTTAGERLALAHLRKYRPLSARLSGAE